MTDSKYPPFQSLVGRVASAPVSKNVSTKRGDTEVLEFRVALPRSFTQGDTEFVGVSIWNDRLQAKAKIELFIGAWVAFLGEWRTREYQGKTYRSFTAAGGGVVQWFAAHGGGGDLRPARQAPTVPVQPAPAEEEDW